MEKRRIKRPFIYYVIAFVLVIGLITSFVVGKYVHVKNKSSLYEASSVYFESDVLDSTNPKSYTYKNGTSEISIKVMNYIDKLRYSETDVKYKVSITDSTGGAVTDSLGNTASSINGTLKGGSKNSEVVTFSNLKSGVYKVTAVLVKPYSKILEGTFELLPESSLVSYNVSDSTNSPLVLLTVSTLDYDGDIQITYPANVAPDSTDALLSSVNSGYDGGTVTVSFKANSEYVFKFFKKTPSEVFSKGDFTVARK